MALVASVCSACHSLHLVTQQGLSKQRWDETLDWMVEEQGMDELNPDDREAVLVYLSTYYGM
jgi:cytochrome c